ncbi:MAG: DUF5683 domain-containing protein [Muribaculaceae bacterium]
MDKLSKGVVIFLCFVLTFPFQLAAEVTSEPQKIANVAKPIKPRVARVEVTDEDVATDSLSSTKRDSIANITEQAVIARQDSIAKDSIDMAYYGKEKIFNPDPTRAVWLSALFPGLGQVYNRRYWKLPIVVGGFVGISYAMTWNNKMLTDYTKAYGDAMDNDPNTKSYMNFYPPNTKEESIDKSWLQKSLKSKKDFYRRNRDLSIICMVGLYFICMVDAYVDASLSHFDITPDLSMQVYPAIIEPNQNGFPSVGIQWAINF